MSSLGHLEVLPLNSTAVEPLLAGGLADINSSQNEVGRKFSDIFSFDNNFGEIIRNPFAPLTSGLDYKNQATKGKQKKRKNR
jgi:hypothetical protein